MFDLKVTVTDTARENEEFAHEMQTARASVDADVLDCTPPIEPPDAGPNDECASNDDCAAGQACFEGICVGEGGLRFADPPRGTYTYWVASSGLVNADDFSIEVSAEGVVQATQTGNIAAFAGGSPRYTFEY